MIKKRCIVKGRKAQLTLFFIIGILLIAVFAFMWYLNSRLSEVQLKAPSEKMIADLLKTGSIPYYVGVCLEEISEDGIEIAGAQGGDIFLDENGTAPNPTRYVPLGARVTYGISAPLLEQDTVYPPPPAYPGGEGKTLQAPKLDFGGWGRFGEVTLRKLCDSHGANSPFAFCPGCTPESQGIISTPICQNNIYADYLSTQWQLEKYIARQVVNCTDWEAIHEKTGYNVTATGDPNITVRLGLSDVWIDAYIPLEIKVGGVEPVYTVGDFHQRLPVRLKRIVELASFMSTYDSYLLWFNLSSGYKYFDEVWDSNINVSISTPLKRLGIWEDVITLDDSASQVKGGDFIFRFARQNRYPALDWIHQMTNDSDIDIVVMENDTIYLRPNPSVDDMGRNVIYDPDEDNLTYYYTGWKETCDEVFNFEFGIPSTACSAKEPTHPSNYTLFPNQGIDINDPLWSFNPQYSHPEWYGLELWEGQTEWLANQRDHTKNNRILYPKEAPHAWTSSDAYLASRKNATYIPNHDDIGPHNVTIWVCDEAGLCDYQVVRIKVYDFPQLQINGTNPYDDIQNDLASVEDFYRLSTEGTTAYYTPLLGYIFNDSVEPFLIKIDHPLQILDLPQTNLGYERDIRYIWNFTFNRSSHCKVGEGEEYPVSKQHLINLSIPEIAVPPKTYNMTVYQCLPHRSTDFLLMWPYNQTEDAYITSHMCCSPGPAYKSNFTIPDDLNNNNELIIANAYPGELAGVKVYTNENGDKPASICNYMFNNQPFNVQTCQPITSLTANPDDLSITIGFSNEPPIETTIYTVEQISDRDENFYSQHPWGSWMPADEKCYEEEPKLGALEYLNNLSDNKGEKQLGRTHNDYPKYFAPGIDPKTQTEYKAWLNDVIFMDFYRQCSGDRGNICSGEAWRTFSIFNACQDLNSDNGEVESCYGPDPALKNYKTFSPTKPLTPCKDDTACNNNRNGICFKGLCYPRTPNPECYAYTDTTFEKAYGLNRTAGGFPKVPAKGLCNENRACSGDGETYDINTKTGKWLLMGATCDQGECSKAPSNNIWKQDCYEYNGLQYKEKKNSFFCELNNNNEDNILDELQSVRYSCMKESPSVPNLGTDCYAEPQSVDADEDERLCDACETHMTNGKWVDNTIKCCGDDLGEGGFPYKNLGSPYNTYGTPNARSPSENSNAGKYSTGEICDDYVDMNDDNAFSEGDIQIDNNCKNGPNCQDLSCYSGELQKGPGGSWCCNTEDSCKTKFSINFHEETIVCGDNLECSCTHSDSSSDKFNEKSPLNVCIGHSQTLSAKGSWRFSNSVKLRLTVEPLRTGKDCNQVSLFYTTDENPPSIDSESISPDTSTITATNFNIAFKNTRNSNCLVTLTPVTPS